MNSGGQPLSLTVVICAYTLERWADIARAVKSLEAQSRRPEEIVLVADHNDELLDRARRTFRGVTCLPNDDRPGLSGARNTGVRASSGDVIAFLDDDAAAEPDWAARLLETYADSDVVGVGGGVVPEWRASRPRWFPEEFLWVVGCSYLGLPADRAPVRNPIGANMSFLRVAFEKAGLFDGTVGRIGKDAGGCEETEFSIRTTRALPGTRILLEPAARVHHAVTPDRVRRRYFRARCRAEGRSKAVVSRLAGADAALASERSYVLRTLPRGVLAGLADACRGDVGGAARAWTIVEGALVTGFSYAVTLLRLRRKG